MQSLATLVVFRLSCLPSGATQSRATFSSWRFQLRYNYGFSGDEVNGNNQQEPLGYIVAQEKSQQATSNCRCAPNGERQ
jgi:hypothetical protein